MKKFLREMVVGFLAYAARKRMKMFTGVVVGITGSVGKTTAKEMLRGVLGQSKKVHANEKSFNSEFGLPLTVLEEKAPVHVWGWAGVLWRSWFKGGRKPKFEVLIVEMGVDKPGDMDYLLSIVRPQIGVFLSVAPVHLAEGQFKNVREIAEEKSKLIKSLPVSGLAVLNREDELVWQACSSAPRKVGYGLGAEADLRAEEVRADKEGISFRAEGREYFLPVVGKHNVGLALATMIVARELGVSEEEIKKGLCEFRMPVGRLNLLKGVGGAVIVDGSYNANPTSVRGALETLGEMSGRRIAVLGQMNELGEESINLHREVGKEVCGKVDVLLTVRGDAKQIGEGAREAGFVGEWEHFETAVEAGKWLSGFVRPEDVVLFKGSQNGVRLEKAVKFVLQNPEQAKELLCRQEENWK